MDFIKEWGMIAGIGGLALGVFMVLFREVIRKKIFAKLTKRQSYIILILFMIFVWSISIISIFQYSISSRGSYQVTVMVHGEKGKDNLVLSNRGKVKLIYGDANVEEVINNKGEATFKQIPPDFFKSGQTVEILFFDPEGEPYRVLNPDSLYQLTKGKYISLVVKLYGLSELKGIVKDIESGELIQNARISILGAETYSNEYGEYILSIPDELQRQYQTVRSDHEGYENLELQNVPVQTENELPILMAPKSEME